MLEKHHNGRHGIKGNVCGGELALTNWEHLLFSVMRKGGATIIEKKKKKIAKTNRCETS